MENNQRVDILGKLRGVETLFSMNPVALIEAQEQNPSATVFVEDDLQENGKVFTACCIGGIQKTFKFFYAPESSPNIFVSCKDASNKAINKSVEPKISHFEKYIQDLYSKNGSGDYIKPDKDEVDIFAERFRMARNDEEKKEICKAVIYYKRVLEETNKAIKFYFDYEHKEQESGSYFRFR